MATKKKTVSDQPAVETPTVLENCQEPKPPVEKVDHVQEFVELAKKLSIAERSALAAQGIYLPEVRDTESRFGVRCVHCNEIAIYLGDEEGIKDPEGNPVEVSTDPEGRPAGINLTQWAWFWHGDGRFDLSKPICQCCGASVRILGNHIPGKLLVEIRPWREERDEALKALQSHRKVNKWGIDRNQALTSSVEIEAGTMSRINDSMPLRTETASKTLDALAEVLDSRGISLGSALRQAAPRGGLAPSANERNPDPALGGRKSYITLDRIG